MATLAAAQAAKMGLRQRLQGQPWLRGIGITQLKCMGPDPYEIQVNIDTMASASLVPRSWLGVPVSVSVIGNITALGTEATTQDYANVALGFVAFLATFMVGKIAVNAIIESRKEHFEKKGQPPEAVKAKESTLDGIMKVAGTGYAIYSIMHDFPEVVTEAKKAFGP